MKAHISIYTLLIDESMQYFRGISKKGIKWGFEGGVITDAFRLLPKLRSRNVHTKIFKSLDVILKWK